MQNNQYGIRGICHFSVPVSDIELSLDYYLALLGAEVYEDDNGPYLLQLIGNEGPYNYSQAFIKAGDAKIELSQTPVGKPKRSPGGTEWLWDQTTPVGTHHALAIGPNDLLPMCERLAELQIPFWGPRAHPGTHSASIYVRDWDGNEFEFCVWDGFPQLDRLVWRHPDWVEDRGFVWDPEEQRATPVVPYEWDGEELVARAIPSPTGS